MNSYPNYFVQRPDGVLCAYWKLDLLLIDYALQPDSHLVKLYKLAPSGFTLQYSPVSIDELREEK